MASPDPTLIGMSPIRNPRRLFCAAAVTVLSVSREAVAASTTSRRDPSRGGDERSGDGDHSGDDRRPPNIILLLTDDQDVLLGGIDKMPNLRSLLVDRGTTFPNAYVHTPICCPSRSSILSGRYLHNGGARNNSYTGNCNGAEWRRDAERKTFAVYAQEAGYVTSYAGKYLNAYGCLTPSTDPGDCVNRVPPGWDKWYGLVGNSRYYDYGVVRSDDGGRTSELVKHGDDYERDYFPDGVANRTLSMIEEFTASQQQKKNEGEEEEERKPFLLVNAWPTPHGPFTPAPWAEHTFDGAQAPRTANWNASEEFMQTKHWIMRRLAPIDSVTEDLIDETYRHRLEALLSVDRHIAEMVDLLERRGELENTIIMYTSDHGYQLGQHRLAVDKRHLYEHDVRVPFVVFSGKQGKGKGKGKQQQGEGRTSERVVLNIDIAPTIYELATGSGTLPQSMDGTSFAKYLIGEEGESVESEASAEEGDDDDDDDPTSRLRDDFLISYHGEGMEPCGMAECPPVPPSQFHGGWMPDSWNNTYHCVRTLKSAAAGGAEAAAATRIREVDDDNLVLTSSNSIYCRFEDTEGFVEYYDISVDPWQLTNRYHDLTDEERKYFEARLARLRTCRGDGCRTRSNRKSLKVMKDRSIPVKGKLRN